MVDLKKNIQIISHKFQNGLSLAVVPLKGIPIVSINLTYFVGSYNESKGTRGFAHLFEHLMFEGTKLLPKGEFDKICTLAGGSNNAYTTFNKTTYLMSLPANQLELGLWLDSDRMFNSQVTQIALDNQKKVVTEEIAQNVENRTYGTFRKYLAELAYDEQSPYSWDVYGDKQDIAYSTLEITETFFKDYYKPNNASLVICGDCDPEEVINLTEKYFNLNSNNGEVPRPDVSNFLVKNGSYFNAPDEVPLSAVFLAFHLPEYSASDNDIAEFISQILVGGKSSILYSELVKKKQIASSVGALINRRKYSSLFICYAIASDFNISCDILYDSIVNELTALHNRNDLDYLCEKSKNRVISALAQEIQYSQGLADTIGNFKTYYGDYNKFYDIIAMMTGTKAEDIKVFASRYFDVSQFIRLDYSSQR